MRDDVTPGAITVDAERLCHALDPAELPFATTAELEAADGMSSQPRVADALDLALQIETTGYNVFATGPARAGKLLVLDEELRRRATSRPAPPDRVYLFDFENPARPAAVALPTGRGPELARDVAALVEEARSRIRAAFESDSYRRRHGDVHERVEGRRQKVLAELQAKAREHEVALELTPAGVMSSPLVDGRPVEVAKFERLAPEQQAEYHESVTKLETIVAATFARLRALEREERDEHLKLDREVALFAIGHLVEESTRRWQAAERVGDWLAALCDDLVGHLPLLRRDAAEPEEQRPLAVAREDGAGQRSPLSRYEVNVLVTHDPEAGAPVIAVYGGSYHDLFGRIEYWNELGAAVTDHRHIRAGAVHRAAGGYLLLRAEDVLTTPFAWARLKEAAPYRPGQDREPRHAVHALPLGLARSRADRRPADGGHDRLVTALSGPVRGRRGRAPPVQGARGLRRGDGVGRLRRRRLRRIRRPVGPRAGAAGLRGRGGRAPRRARRAPRGAPGTTLHPLARAR